jgi:hypothetical protein
MFAHVTEIELAQVTSPSGEFDRERLTESYARPIAPVLFRGGRV